MSETVSLFYPELAVRIGDYTIDRHVDIELCSSCESYYDWCCIQIQPELRDVMTVNRHDAGSVRLGYDGQLEQVFAGSVVKTGPDEILLKDDMLKLERTKITCTFLDAGPVEIAEYCLRMADVTQYKLFADTFPKKPSVSFREKTVVQVLEDIKAIWGITDLFYFAGGVFYFGQKPPQKKIYTLTYGESIISLTREGSQWAVETASVPFIHHSDVIRISHPELAAGPKEVTVCKVVFRTSDAGFIRTRIYF